jgi:hypothetical protein
MMRSRGQQNPGNNNQRYDSSPAPDSAPARAVKRPGDAATASGAPALCRRLALAAALALLLLLFVLRPSTDAPLQPANGDRARAITLLSTAAQHHDAAARAAALAAAPPLHTTVRLPGPRPLKFPPPQINDALLRAVADACAQRQDTYILVHGSEGAVVSSTDFVNSVSARACPPVDIMLAGEHRSIGL